MSVWYAIPSARPDGGTVGLWMECGYKVAIQVDPGTVTPKVDYLVTTPYQGYAHAVNRLCKDITHFDPSADWIVTGGDDISPDPNRIPEDIARECVKHFGGTYGVMQPTGDRWMIDKSGRSCSERVAYSPWMGRAWVLEANEGIGPIWYEYFHFYEDEELQCVAEMQGVFWQRPDLVQYHDHWIRGGKHKRPQHLIRKDSAENWATAKALFESRKAAGFPGSRRLDGTRA